MTCHPFLERYITISIPRSLKKREREGNWTQSTFAKTSGTVIGDRGKKWPNADRCGTNYGSYSFLKWRIPRLFLLFLPCRRQERRHGNEDGSFYTWYKTAMLFGREKHTGTEKQKELLSLKMVIFQCAVSWLHLHIN